MRIKVNVKAFMLAILIGISANPNAGIPVIDGANLTQNITNTIENVTQTLKQVEEYKTQLDQYANQLQNTMAPAMNIWDDATTTMNRLRGAIDTLKFYKTRLGSLDSYLKKFGDLDDYMNSPCFNGSGGCTATELTKLEETRSLGYESQQRANRALFEGLEQQQNAIEDDARQLERLQSAATGAVGQMEAIGYANQLASQQANQLLHIRGLLIAQQNAVTTKMQADMAKEAQQEAADSQFLRRNYRASTGRTW
ncbi:P-type conjugative transfer protein TrbJ [Thiolapillus sp.]|uniref:P-type conjugative transfer protein TrbJ n=4 Tax=Thiolapillus sp. TaxID=2017437 RepID=UPI003AF887B1